MGLMDHQIGFKDESVYGTAVVVDRFFEYESESIEDTFGRTESNPLRGGSGFMRNDRFTPYYSGAAGTVRLSVMTKGFGYFLKHMMGAVGTTGPTDTVAYTHTGTEATLLGDSFTCQINRPFNPSGTNQALTYEGGKVASWTLSNAVDGNLLCDLDLDFEQVATGTALATASYPSGMENLTWAGGVISIGGSAVDLTEFSLQVSNGLDVDRRQIRGNTDKKEPVATRREGTFSLACDFESLTQRTRAASATQAGALAAISAVWTGPTIISGGASVKPSLTVTIPQVRFDTWSAPTSGPEALSQSLSGVVRYNGSNSPISLVYVSGDTTP